MALLGSGGGAAWPRRLAARRPGARFHPSRAAASTLYRYAGAAVGRVRAPPRRCHESAPTG